MKAYIASGWFTPDQIESLEEIIRACRESLTEFYSPRDEMLYTPDTFDSTDVFDENIRQIRLNDFVIASTEGKDMGTLFECGVAFAYGVPIVYFFKGEGKFNLMLSESSYFVCRSFEELVQYLQDCEENKHLIRSPYKGDIE
jgi:nucleoside 2-deoxyribosyltransferase